MQGTFIGVLMSSTLPARLGEPSRALIVARRLGRARETLPVVLGTMVSQTLLNLLALAILGGVTLSSVSVLDGHGYRALLPVASRRSPRSSPSRWHRFSYPEPSTDRRSAGARGACSCCWSACAARSCACATVCASSASPARPRSP